MKDTDKIDVEFLKSPGRWPCWPCCPVRRSTGVQGGFPDHGIVLAECASIVYWVNLFFFSMEDLKTCEKHEYESAEAMVADGWEVD